MVGTEEEPVTRFPKDLEIFRDPRDPSDLGVRKWLEYNASAFRDALGADSANLIGFSLGIRKEGISPKGIVCVTLDFESYHPFAHLLGRELTGSPTLQLALVRPGLGYVIEQIFHFRELEVLPRSRGLSFRSELTVGVVTPDFRVHLDINPTGVK